MSLDRSRALSLLRQEGCDEKLIRHCLAVSKRAVEIAKKVEAGGHDVDVGFVETAAILHDIGRSRTHGITHGIEGAGMLKDYPEYAKVCERHIGGGISRDDAGEVGLPPGDYIPETVEERIIAHADNTISGDRVVSLDERIMELEAKLGKSHPAIKKIRELGRYIESLTD